ncbi:MAG: hypothetical protein IGS39_20390 [Calothrix sp. C42_A2020_038]|nr:hypothetical protein [Calothrix sp. C42_A2020_038]
MKIITMHLSLALLARLKFMSRKLGRSLGICFGVNVVIITGLASVTITPAQATSLKNVPFEQKEEFKILLNQNKDISNNLLKLSPNIKNFLSNKHDNEIEYRLFQETQDTLNEVKQASKVTQENIDGKTIVYFYSLESTKPTDQLSNNTNISGTYQILRKLPAPPARRKVSEPATGFGVVILSYFTVQHKLKRVGKY